MSSFRRLLSLTSVRVYHSQTLVQSRSLGGVWRGTAVRGTAVGIRSLWSARGGLHNRSSQGKKLWTESFLGLSFTALLVKYRPVVVWAMDEEDYEDMLESDSGYLDVDPCSFLAFTLKLEMPIFFLVTLVMGWAYPITIAIHAVIFLFCTRPSPYSIHVILEQFRRSAMRQDPGFYKSKLCYYVKKVEVEDYLLMCLAKVELSDANLSLVGILGNWWVLPSSLGADFHPKRLHEKMKEKLRVQIRESFDNPGLVAGMPHKNVLPKFFMSIYTSIKVFCAITYLNKCCNTAH